MKLLPQICHTTLCDIVTEIINFIEQLIKLIQACEVMYFWICFGNYVEHFTPKQKYLTA